MPSYPGHGDPTPPQIQHVDLVGKAITSLALAPRLRRGQLLVQAHGNTLRLVDLRTYQV